MRCSSIHENRKVFITNKRQVAVLRLYYASHHVEWSRISCRYDYRLSSDVCHFLNIGSCIHRWATNVTSHVRARVSKERGRRSTCATTWNLAEGVPISQGYIGLELHVSMVSSPPVDDVPTEILIFIHPSWFVMRRHFLLDIMLS